MDRRAAGGESSDGEGSSSSSSDSVLIPMPLDQRHRKKLQAQLQLEQQRQREKRADADREREKDAGRDGKAVKEAGKERRGDVDCPPSRKKVAFKSEQVCVVCESGDGAPLVACAGPCVSAFHAACLPPDEQASALGDPETKTWRCRCCRDKRHECFHCKEVGAEQASGEEDGAASDAGEGAVPASTKGPVRKCRALSCGKYYHLDCITQFPLARIAGTHFICPLHTCTGCDKSGAQKEAVRCVRCPVAYHSSCLPADGVLQLTSKLIVCPKHKGVAATAAAVVAPVKDRESSRHQRVQSADATNKEPAVAAVPEKSESSHRSKRRLDEVAREDGAESEASERSAVSSTSTGDKKLHRSKKEKRDKKKKKKKKKKMKRRDSRGRLASSSQDEGSTAASGDEGDRASREAGGAFRRELLEEVGASRRDSAVASPPVKTLKREPSDDVDVTAKAPATSSAHDSADEEASGPSATSSSPHGADSPSLRASLLFESPATTKQRLVEALGNSDDELDDEDAGEATEVPRSSTATESRASTVQAAIDQAELEEKPVTRVEDSVSPRKEAVSDVEVRELQQKSKSRPSLSPIPQEMDELQSGLDPVDLKRNSPSGPASSGASSIHRILNSPATSSVKLEQGTIDAVNSPKVERLAVRIPKSSSSSSLTSAAKVGRSTKTAASEGEEGDDEGPGGVATPRSRRIARIKAEQSATGTPRGGNRSGSGGKKKKRKGKSSKTATESDNDAELTVATGEGEVAGGEAKWVQCDNCRKWRTVPQSIDLASMPERWYCHMNSWNRAFASCEVAEEDLKQRTPQKAPPQELASERSKKKSSKKKKAGSSSLFGGTGSDGGSSSSSSAAGSAGKSGRDSTSAAANSVSTPEAGDSTSQHAAKQLKKLEKQDKQDKQEKQEKRKKRKLTKIKDKDKYRELKWVQCESAQCGKWRVVPSSSEFDLLPARWYCHLNTWAPELAKCSAPNPPEVEAFLLKQAAKDAAASPATGSRSQSNKRPKPSSSASGDGAPSAIQTSGATSVDASDAARAPLSVHDPGSKPAKTSKSAKSSTHTSQAQQQSASSGGHQQSAFKADASSPSSSSSNVRATVLSAVAVATGTTPHAIDTKTGAFRDACRPSSKSSGGGSSGQVKKTVLEWAMCEKCNKWRKLPSHIKSSTLPDKWYCSMNYWDPARAKCSIPEEVEPEPLAFGPIPGTPGWYHGSVGGTKTGNGGGGGGGSRPRRGKLSYSELLYASTGQLRKAYTPESSTLSFEYEGVTYNRDDMYKSSSLYVSPDAMRKAIAEATALDSSSSPRDSSSSAGLPSTPAFPAAWMGLAVATSLGDGGAAASGISAVVFAGVGQPAQEPTAMDRVASTVLAAMDLRHEWSVSELFDKMNAASRGSSGASIALPLLAAALGELEFKGQIERLDGEQSHSWKRRKTEAEQDGPSPVSSEATILYRKVPARPLKATKWWRTAGRSASASPLPST